MKSLPNAGNIKMRGKKTKSMRCSCCVCQDYRDMVTEKAAEKEIKDFIKQPNIGE